MEFPSRFLPRVGMRTLRGNIGSRTALRNEKYKEKGWRKREEKEDVGGAESRGAGGIALTKFNWLGIWWMMNTLSTFTFQPNHCNSKENLTWLLAISAKMLWNFSRVTRKLRASDLTFLRKYFRDCRKCPSDRLKTTTWISCKRLN